MNDFSSFLGAHTLWEFPILTMKYGGVVFILIYLVMFLLLGTPLLLLEMTIGQYSALSPTKLYRNLCPVSKGKVYLRFYYFSNRKNIFLTKQKITLQILTGVGFAICVSCMFQSMVDMAVITWSSKAFYLLFTDQSFAENFFFGSVLDHQDEIALDNLGVLHGQLSLCLGIACLVIFILIAAGTKSVGKVSREPY